MRDEEREIEETIRQEIDRRTDCLPHSRLASISLGETAMTDEERSHVRKCDRCSSWVYRELRRAAREIPASGERIDHLKKIAGLSDDEVIERIKKSIPSFDHEQWTALTHFSGSLGARDLFAIQKALDVPLNVLCSDADPMMSYISLGEKRRTPSSGEEESKPPSDPADDAGMEVRDFLPIPIATDILRNFACGDEALERWLVEYFGQAKPYQGLLARVIAESCLRKNHKGAKEYVDRLVEAAGDVEDWQMVALLRQGHQRRHVFEFQEAVEPLQKARDLASSHSRHLIAFNAFYELGRLATDRPHLTDVPAEELIRSASVVQATHLSNRKDLALRVRYAEVQRLHKAGNFPQVIEESERILHEYENAQPRVFEGTLDYIRTTLGVALRRRGTEEARRRAQDLYQRAFTRNRPRYYQGMCSYLEADLSIDRMIEALGQGDRIDAKRHHAAALECCTLAKELLDKTGDIAAQQKANTRLQWLQHLEVEDPAGRPERTFALREFDFAHFFLGAPDLNRPGPYAAGSTIRIPDDALRSLIGKYLSGLWVPGSDTPIADVHGSAGEYVSPSLSYVVSCPIGDQLLVRLYDKVGSDGQRVVTGAYALNRYNTDILRTLGEFRGMEGPDFRASRWPMFDDLQKAVDVATPLPKAGSVDSIVLLPPNKNEGWSLSLDWLRTKDAKTGQFGPSLIEVAKSQLVYGVSDNPAKGMAVRVVGDDFRIFASTQSVSGQIVHSIAASHFGDRINAFDVPDTSRHQPVARTVEGRGVIVMAHADSAGDLQKTLGQWEFPDAEAVILVFCQSTTYSSVSGPFIDGFAVTLQRRLAKNRPTVVIASRVPVEAQEATRFAKWLLSCGNEGPVSERVTSYLKDRQKDGNPFVVPWIVLC